jgi:glycosyltransferase involved in cell wall biosynthesis
VTSTIQHRIVMVATSYPRFAGDTVGTFMEPIAQSLAARGHDVHLVLPWHPRWNRPTRDGGVTFHLFKYSPHPSLNVFGYAGALQADVRLRGAAFAAAPLALVAGWDLARRVARQIDATILHGHWVIPGGAIAAAARGSRPLVVSLHGSDVYVAERHAAAGRVARGVFARAAMVTACSDDLRQRAIALGAAADRAVTIPYGVDAARFAPDPASGLALRQRWGLAPDDAVLFAAGRFVRKKGFEYLIDAVALLAPAWPSLRLVLAGDGDLDGELRERARARGMSDRVLLPGVLPHGEIATALAAADVAVVPSVRDDAGNVDGLPNVVMEALASGTPLVATTAGGIGSVLTDRVTGRLVAERDVAGLAAAIAELLADPEMGGRLGAAARAWALREGSWTRAAERFEEAFDAACRQNHGRARV